MNQQENEIACLEENQWFRDARSAWWQQLKKPTAKELLEIFPEAVGIMDAKIAEETERLEETIRELRQAMIHARNESTETQEFLASIWRRFTFGPLIEESCRRITLYRQYKTIAKGRGEARGERIDIVGAKSVRIETLLDSPKRVTENHVYARCPFHNDRSPSFVIYRSSNKFHCFGCVAHGDVIDFVMRQRSLSFKDTVRQLSGN